jgi:hypothetical protein
MALLQPNISWAWIWTIVDSWAFRLIEQRLPISQRNPQVSKAVQDNAALGIGNDRHGALTFSGFAPESKSIMLPLSKN